MLRKKGIVIFIAVSIILSQVFSVNFASAASLNNNVVNIKDFGAHSIDEAGYDKFDSSAAINSAIQYAKSNGKNTVDFGEGRYYATRISLESNMTYISSNGAELIASPDTKPGYAVLQASKKSDIKIQNLKINGNWDVVQGSPSSGSELIALFDCDGVSIENCYLYHNMYLGILLAGCNNITITGNTIFDTDCGVETMGNASNNLVIDGNLIYGEKIQNSEPISIYNSNNNGLAHDITITNNILHDKRYGSGILVRNAEKILIKGNKIYNVAQGISAGEHSNKEVQFTVATNITITENEIYNTYSGGMSLEIDNSLIFKNNIHDINGSGIWMKATYSGLLSKNNTISENTITNVNSDNLQAPGIRLTSTQSTMIEKNNIADTRAEVRHYANIQITGSDNDNNIVKDNTYGKTMNKKFSILIKEAKNTVINDNNTGIVDQGNGTKIVRA